MGGCRYLSWSHLKSWSSSSNKWCLGTGWSPEATWHESSYLEQSPACPPIPHPQWQKRKARFYEENLSKEKQRERTNQRALLPYLPSTPPLLGFPIACPPRSSQLVTAMRLATWDLSSLSTHRKHQLESSPWSHIHHILLFFKRYSWVPTIIEKPNFQDPP